MTNTTNRPIGGAEIAARMTPEARSERARTAAMKRHYSRLIPVMVEYLRDPDMAWCLASKYPSLGELPTDAYKWVFREARRAMGY